MVEMHGLRVITANPTMLYDFRQDVSPLWTSGSLPVKGEKRYLTGLFLKIL